MWRAPDAEQSVFRRNFDDLRLGLGQKDLILKLGISEIAQRYRNTIIGPFWMTISLSIFLVVLGFVGGGLFNIPVKEYLPYLCAGLITWTYISAILNEGCQIYVAAPLSVMAYGVKSSVFIYSFLLRQAILFAHNFLVFLAIALYFDIPILNGIAWLIISLPIMAVFSFSCVTLLSIVSIRYRDIPQVVASAMQVMFFVTPVMWKAELLEQRGRAFVLDWNPLYYLIELIRQPIMGGALSMKVVFVSMGITAVMLTLAIAVYMRFRHRISFYQ